MRGAHDFFGDDQSYCDGQADLMYLDYYYYYYYGWIQCRRMNTKTKDLELFRDRGAGSFGKMMCGAEC